MVTFQNPEYTFASSSFCHGIRCENTIHNQVGYGLYMGGIHAFKDNIFIDPEAWLQYRMEIYCNLIRILRYHGKMIFEWINFHKNIDILVRRLVTMPDYY